MEEITCQDSNMTTASLIEETTEGPSVISTAGSRASTSAGLGEPATTAGEMDRTEMETTDSLITEMYTDAEAEATESVYVSTEYVTWFLPTTEEPCVPTDDCTGHYTCRNR